MLSPQGTPIEEVRVRVANDDDVVPLIADDDVDAVTPDHEEIAEYRQTEPHDGQQIEDAPREIVP